MIVYSIVMLNTCALAHSAMLRFGQRQHHNGR